MRQSQVLLLFSGGVAALLWGCSFVSSGVSPDGQEDIASARQVIERGGIPDPNAITVEGFLSEHVVPVEGSPGAADVYLATTEAWHRDFDALTPQATVQVGFGTNINVGEFSRSLLNLGLVIDRSSSMAGAIDDRRGTTKLEAVKIAVDRMLGQLTGEDRVSIAIFNDQVETLIEAVPGTDISTIKGALDLIEVRGPTDLATGLERGLELVSRNRSEGRLDRVMVFTDARLYGPGIPGLEEFLGVMRSYADENVGTTLFGVGTDVGDDVAYEISQIRGGNYYFLGDYERIVSVFDDEFDFLVAPVAYDITLEIDVPFEFDVVDVYGLPAEPPFGHSLQLTVPTLFLGPSQSGSAVFVRLRAGSLVNLDEPNILATVKLTYTSADGSQMARGPKVETLPAGLDSNAEPPYFKTQGAQRSILLLNTVLTLKSICEEFYQNGIFYLDREIRENAAARINEFLLYFDAQAAGLEDRLSPDSRSLSEERELLVQLRDNLGG